MDKKVFRKELFPQPLNVTIAIGPTANNDSLNTRVDIASIAKINPINEAFLIFIITALLRFSRIP